MKYRLALVLIILIVSGMVAALVGAQSTPDVTPTSRPGVSSVTKQDIFVRAGPGQQYLPVGQLLAGNIVVPVARNAQADWVLIIYRTSAYGWIRRDLATWVENIDALPIISENQLTPSPGFFPTNPPTTTIIFLPTDTPSGSYVLLQADAQSGFVRAGPGRTYLRLGQLYPGDQVDPVGRTADTLWILIRFDGGFGWIRYDLVKWTNDLTALPILSLDNLTPTATFTPSNTPTITPSTTASASASSTASYTPTNTSTLTPSSTATATLTLTSTSTTAPTATAILIPAATDTFAPSSTPTSTSTFTPTATDTTAPTQTSTATSTETPTQTNTSTPTNTDTPVPTATFAAIPVASETSAALALAPSTTSTATITPSLTSTLTATWTATVTPSVTNTTTSTPSETASATAVPPTRTSSATSLPPNATVIVVVPTVSSPVPTKTPLPPNATVVIVIPTTGANAASPIPSASPTKKFETATPTESSTAVGGAGVTITPIVISGSPSAPNGGGIPLEAILGGTVVLLVVIYIALYYRGVMAANRYASGFVLERCPVCGRGHLIVETRQERLFGVPRPRRIVRCDECRSVLRETSPHHWRYAIDPVANPDLYRRYNGQELDEQTLADLAHEASQGGHNPVPHSPASPPGFVDDDQ